MNTTLQVTKRDQTLTAWNLQKIARAIALVFYELKNPGKPNTLRNTASSNYGLSPKKFAEALALAQKVEAKVVALNQSPVSIEVVQDSVETVLLENSLITEARTYIAYRQLHAVKRLKDYHTNGLEAYIAVAKYARYNEAAERRETWQEASERVKDMHKRVFSPHLDNAVTLPVRGETTVANAIEVALNGVADKDVLPSMRSLQFGGPAIEKSHSRIYNCSFSPVNRIAWFKEFFYLLLSGTGCGFSVQKHHVAQLPALKARINVNELAVRHYTIPDTIEGWSDSVDVLLESYIKGYYVEFNYSSIRKKGAALKTSGGKAPGHLSLKKCLETCGNILDKAQGRHLKTIEVYDIAMFIAKAVLSGGIRRSATICLFSPEDEDMMNAKTGNWFTDNPQRSGSNNSAILLRGKTDKALFDKLFNAQKEFGEPGFYFTDDLEWGTNPCVTGDTLIQVSPTETITMLELVNRFNRNLPVQVKSYNTSTNFIQYKKVTAAALTRVAANTVELTFKSASNLVTVKATPDHKFFTANRGYVEASELIESDILRNSSGQATTFVSRVEASPEDVFDITVADNNNFYANSILVHNCVEIGLNPHIKVSDLTAEERTFLEAYSIDLAVERLTGWQMCNLSTINGRRCTTPEEFYMRVEQATIIGTLQAAYTTIPYLGPITEVILRRDALLGVSICGIMDNPQVLLKPEVLQKGAQIAKETNAALAKAIGINAAARITCTKPEGTSSLILECGSGIHAHHARNYFRRVQANKLEQVYKHFAATNPQMVENSVWNPETDAVITFPVQATPTALLKKDVDAIKFLEYVKLVQQNWVIPGANTNRDPKLMHNVSNTCTVENNEWDKVQTFIWDNQEFFTGISLLSSVGDKVYKQAPREEVTTDEDIAKWNALEPKPVDYKALKETEDNTNLKAIVACAGGACELI